MAATQHLYRRTEAGKLAWQRQDPNVPLEYRRVLGVVEGETHPDFLRARMPQYSSEEAVHVLDELVERGLLEAIKAGEHHDLDFTGEFAASDFKKTSR